MRIKVYHYKIKVNDKVDKQLMNKFFIFVTVILTSINMSEESKIAAQFVRESLNIQFNLTKTVSEGLKQSIVIFCLDGCNEGGETHLYDTIRYTIFGGVYSVCGGTSQKVFKSTNTYHQYLGNRENVEVTQQRVTLKYKDLYNICLNLSYQSIYLCRIY